MVPLRCTMSWYATPTAFTLTSTSVGLMSGSATSSILRTSGAPSSRMTTALIKSAQSMRHGHTFPVIDELDKADSHTIAAVRCGSGIGCWHVDLKTRPRIEFDQPDAIRHQALEC